MKPEHPSKVIVFHIVYLYNTKISRMEATSPGDALKRRIMDASETVQPHEVYLLHVEMLMALNDQCSHIPRKLPPVLLLPCQ